MIDINIVVEADEDIIQRLADSPEANFALKMVQRDATYRGGEQGVADFVYKVVETSWGQTLQRLQAHLREVLTTPDLPGYEDWDYRT